MGNPYLGPATWLELDFGCHGSASCATHSQQAASHFASYDRSTHSFWLWLNASAKARSSVVARCVIRTAERTKLTEAEDGVSECLSKGPVAMFLLLLVVVVVVFRCLVLGPLRPWLERGARLAREFDAAAPGNSSYFITLAMVAIDEKNGG